MRLKVLFFGQLKDVTGRSEEALEVPEGARVNDVFNHYAASFPRMRELGSSIVIAVNQEFSPGSAAVSDGDEIAFLPPVSGGSDRWSQEVADEAGHFFGLTREPIDTVSIRQKLLSGTDGAIVDFVGVVRNNTNGRATRFLEYECYEPMAVRMMAQIGREIASNYAIGRIAMVHRLGRLEIGEASVAVIVTAPHRKPAFDAALEGINRLKRLVPVWKKEHFVDGEIWVDGEWDPTVLQR